MFVNLQSEEEVSIVSNYYISLLLLLYFYRGYRCLQCTLEENFERHKKCVYILDQHQQAS